jgi:hypothetical protein
MALAETDPTRIDDLDDLLRYLTEELGNEKYAALWEMEQKYLDGQLQLTKREYRIDGTPYGDAVTIDALYGHIELDRRGRVQIVPLIPLWREVRYGIAEGCDARAIWPHPPKADPVKTGVTDRPSAEQSSQESKAEGWQISKVRDVLKEFVFAPDGRPPTDTSVKAVQTDVNRIFDAWGWKLASRDTVARAMGRRRI